MSILGLLILSIGVLVLLRKSKQKSRLVHIHPFNWIDYCVVVVLILAFVLPAQSLSTDAINRKTLNTPETTNNNSQPSSDSCPTRYAETVDEWVYQISEFRQDCFIGREISLSGSVFQETTEPLPLGYFYIGRVVVSCCVIDSRPYALPIVNTIGEVYPLDAWLDITGTLDAQKINGTDRIVIIPNHISIGTAPENPYQFLGEN